MPRNDGDCHDGQLAELSTAACRDLGEEVVLSPGAGAKIEQLPGILRLMQRGLDKGPVADDFSFPVLCSKENEITL